MPSMFDEGRTMRRSTFPRAGARGPRRCPATASASPSSDSTVVCDTPRPTLERSAVCSRRVRDASTFASRSAVGPSSWVSTKTQCSAGAAPRPLRGAMSTQEISASPRVSDPEILSSDAGSSSSMTATSRSRRPRSVSWSVSISVMRARRASTLSTLPAASAVRSASRRDWRSSSRAVSQAASSVCRERSHERERMSSEPRTKCVSSVRHASANSPARASRIARKGRGERILSRSMRHHRGCHTSSRTASKAMAASPRCSIAPGKSEAARRRCASSVRRSTIAGCTVISSFANIASAASRLAVARSGCPASSKVEPRRTRATAVRACCVENRAAVSLTTRSRSPVASAWSPRPEALIASASTTGMVSGLSFPKDRKA